jgi:hypothetical protein
MEIMALTCHSTRIPIASRNKILIQPFMVNRYRIPLRLLNALAWQSRPRFLGQGKDLRSHQGPIDIATL